MLWVWGVGDFKNPIHPQIDLPYDRHRAIGPLLRATRPHFARWRLVGLSLGRGGAATDVVAAVWWGYDGMKLLKTGPRFVEIQKMKVAISDGLTDGRTDKIL